MNASSVFNYATSSYTGAAVTAACVAGSLMLGGGTIFILADQGKNLALANSAPMVGSLCAKVAAVGEGIFLAGAVPVYACLYEGPKYIITNTPRGLSFIARQVGLVFTKALSLTKDYLLVPLAKNINLFANFLFDNAIVPFVKSIHSFGNFIIRQVTPVLKNLVNVVSKAATFVLNKAIIPTLNAVKATATALFTHVIQPAFTYMKDSFVWAVNQAATAMKGLVNSVARAATFVLNKAIIPILNAVKTAAMALFTHVIRPAFTYMKDGFVWCISKAARGLYKGLEVVTTCAQNVLSAFKIVWNSIASAAIFISQKVIMPVWEAVKTTSNWCLETATKAAKAFQDYVLSPATHAASVAVASIKNTWNSVIYPFGEAFSTKVSQTFDSVTATISSLFERVQGAFTL